MTETKHGARPDDNAPVQTRRAEPTPPAQARAQSHRSESTTGPRARPPIARSTREGREGRFESLLRGEPVDRSAMDRARGVPEGQLTARDAVHAAKADGSGTPKDAGEAASERRGARERAADDLATWAPPPPALLPPLTGAPVQSAPAGSAAQHAEAAALAEQLVTSMRVGRVGKDGHEVRMRLAIRGGTGLEVRLRAVGGSLSAELSADSGMHAEAHRIADSLREELAARGLTLDDVQVT